MATSIRRFLAQCGRMILHVPTDARRVGRGITRAYTDGVSNKFGLSLLLALESKVLS